MEQSGEHRFAAAKARVWEALNDPEVLKRCIPGCQSLTLGEDGVFHGVVAVKVGPLSASFSGEVTLKDLDPPTSYTLEVGAKGGAAGFARGEAKVALAEDGDRTLLTYNAGGRVGGKLAQIGQRLVDAAARKTADDFFGALAHELETPAEADAATSAAPAPSASRKRVLAWGGALAGAIALGLLAWRLLAR
jgi:carbon monoxide dehydrogenase subunit G